MFPQNNKARLKIVSGERKNENGRITYYFHTLRHDENDAKLKPSRHCSWKGKVYLKQLNDTWHIRFEVTLANVAIKRYFKQTYFGTDTFLDQIFQSLSNINVYDFWQFKKFNWLLFSQFYVELLHKKISLNNRIDYKIALKIWYSKLSFEQKTNAMKLARRLKSKYLERRISKGDFYINCRDLV